MTLSPVAAGAGFLAILMAQSPAMTAPIAASLLPKTDYDQLCVVRAAIAAAASPAGAAAGVDVADGAAAVGDVPGGAGAGVMAAEVAASP